MGKRKVLTLTDITITEENGSKEDVLAFADNYGFMIDKEEALAIIEKLIKFYENDVDDFIKKENRETSLLHNPYFELVREENGKFKLPQPSAVRKVFRDDILKHWGFTCCWCGKRVSSKTHKEYYTLKLPIPVIEIKGDQPWERACSKECCELTGKEHIKNWIIENGYEEFFNL